jgi:hypothetical protein
MRSEPPRWAIRDCSEPEGDQRNVAGEGRRPANVNRALPINFCGGPDEIVAQLKEAVAPQ